MSLSQGKPKKNIAVFSLAYQPFEGGAEIALREIASRIKDIHFTIFTHRFSKTWEQKEERDNITIVRLGRGSDQDWYKQRGEKRLYIKRAWQEAEKHHRHNPFDVIWASMAAYAGGAALLFKKRYPDIPLILTLQEGDTEKHILERVGFLLPVWKKIFTAADHIQVISTYLKTFAKRHGAQGQISIIPNGVSDVRERTKHGDGKTIITTSRLVPKNGVDTLIKAFAFLNYQLPTTNYKLIIVGGGPEEERLKKLAKEENVSERVVFKGQMPSEKIGAELEQADIFVRLSRSEGLGSSFLEAMAKGLPVIGTRVGGIPDFLIDNETGLFAEIDNPEDCAAKIEKLIRSKELQERLGEKGRSLVKEKYTWEIVSKGFEIILQNTQPRINCLITTGIFPPEIGGSATYSSTLLQEFTKKNIIARVLTYGKGNKKGVIYISKKIPKGLRHAIFGIKLIALGLRSDILLAADSSIAAATVTAYVAKMIKKPYLVRVTGDYAWEQGVQRFGVKEFMNEFQRKAYRGRVNILRKAQRFAVENATYVIAPSEYLAKITAGWGVKCEKIKVISNNVEINESGIKKEEIREKIGIAKNNFLLVSTGRLVPWKGFATVIDTVQELRQKKKEIQLFIIGDGPDKEKLQQRIKEKNAEQYIFLIGRMPKKTLAQYIEASDIFVLNTAYEGFSHQLIEAMQLGCAIITTRVGGNEELIKNGKTGILIEYNKKEELRNNINKLIESRTMRNKLGENAKEESKQYSGEAMIEATNKLLREALKS
ncbi:MAG: hypothetical protein COU08_01800 [Candidatus Harrisonbacteria bacterium CG10_big_fil_rev_8_21_14_0_10_42_17]|uniref:Glycosyltransferase n=1 Tax=Candidatus Harrisonbacteria bacterium CG10_big_fil_rev_8_21_14_0_10_42_17 TaxID=1974584 RepID=A0A2M6WIC3_9BACT|nr:MAG: hypothetical protein COU08_01800 [Candidatus Harrisonbacteria bacterium CG10_big_fil_rev_8_21_14_0_10_42_17]